MMPKRPDGPAKRFLRPAPAAAVLTIVILCSAVLYGIVPGARKSEDSGGCPSEHGLLRSLAPLAHGELAAFSVLKSPRPFPPVAFQADHHRRVGLKNFSGKFVLLNIWATWCVPCRVEMPSLDKLQAKLGGPKFEVVAVNVDATGLGRRRGFLARAGVKNLSLFADPSGHILETLKDLGQVVGLPTSILIDPHGCEIGFIPGPANWNAQDAVSLIKTAVEPTQKRNL